MKSIVFLAMMTNLFTACGMGNAQDTVSNLPASVFLNVKYGPDSRQVMDIYLPAGRTVESTKLMFLIHGGSWSSGDKSSFQSYIDSLKVHSPDYAFVNVNYRLASFTENKFPTQENDIKSALTQVLKKADEYAISKDVVLLGASAGAHLALLQAYKYSDPVKVKAVVSFFGPSDFMDMYNNPVHPQVPQLLELLIGGNPATNPGLYHQASPAYFITPQTCPTIMFQGGIDPVVNIRQANTLRDKLNKAGVENKLIVYPREGHGWTGTVLSDSFDKITDFLRENV